MDIRKEVECPICLGIIRNTRMVLECLHRFCKDCIEKSLRLGNNECPACSSHCASRHSSRDDPSFDALILALYPDFDKEEEELAFSVEKTGNKKIQGSIDEALRRQREPLEKKRSTEKAIGTSRSQRNMQARKRGPTSSLEDREENDNDGCKEWSLVDERSQDVKKKRARRCPLPRSSPARHKVPSKVDCHEEGNATHEAIRQKENHSGPLSTEDHEDLSSEQNTSLPKNDHNANGFGNLSEPSCPPSPSICSYPDSEFHKFEESRTCDKFEPGQIWALYSDHDKLPKFYGWISKVKLQPFIVHLIWLEACPEQEQKKSWLEPDMPICCD